MTGGGRNESYVDSKIKRTLTRSEVVKKVETEKYPGSHIAKINNRK